MRYKSVLFDLDGTLVDSREGIQNGFGYAMRKLRGEGWDGSLPVDYIGPPLRDTFKNFYGMDAEQAEEAVRLYREYYRPTGIYECSVYPYVTDMLERLKQAGAGIYLATSKPRVFAQTVLDHTGLTRFFSGIAGCGLDGSMGQKADVIRYLLANVIPSAGLPALMVGDRLHDAEGARECALDCAAALWGYGSREEFLPYGNVRMLFTGARELCDWLMGEDLA